MIALYLGIHSHRIYLWGSVPGTGKQRNIARSPLTSDIRPLPGAASKPAIMAVVEQMIPAFDPRSLKGRRVAIWLPTAAEQPILPMVPVDPRAEVTLRPWSVMAIDLPPSYFGSLLQGLLLEPSPDITLGTEFQTLMLAWNLMIHMTMRAAIVPTVRPATSTTWDATWAPLLSPLDEQIVGILANRLAPVTHALADIGAPMPQRTARQTLLDFLSLLIADFSGSVTFQLQETSPQYFEHIFFGGYSGNRTFNIHDRWIQAFTSPSRRMRGTPEEMHAFTTQITDWHTQLRYARSEAFRLCVRLEEPDMDVPDTPDSLGPAGDLALDVAVAAPDEQHHAGGGSIADPPPSAVILPAHTPVVTTAAVEESAWRVRFALQSISDPSLLLPATDLERDDLSPLLTEGESIHRLRLTFRQAIDQVAEHWPLLRDRLGDDTGPLAPNLPAPATITLSLLEAFQFLTTTAGELEQHHIGVQLPAWWVRGSGKRVGVRARVTSAQQGPGMLGEEALLHFDWQIALGGVPISPRELQELAEAKAPLICVRGKWMHVSAEEIQAAIQFWKKRGQRRDATLSEVARLTLDHQAEVNGLRVEGMDLEGWVGTLLNRLRSGNSTLEELPPPAGLRATLRPYQIRGFSWMQWITQWGMGACLADDMGLGKTLQTLALIQRDRDASHGRPVLIVCPTSVIGNWLREAERFTPDLSIMIHHGGVRRKDERFAEAARQHAIVVTSYALLHRDLAQLNDVAWRGIILDEAQNIKNPETKQTQAALALRGDYRIALTGTPVENSVTDLWSLMEFLNPGLLGTNAEFKRTFFTPIQIERDQEALARLRQLTGPFILRRMKTDPKVIADLPEKLEMPVYCSLTKEQAALYSAVLRKMEQDLAEAEGIQRRGIILATLTRLKQVCNHPAHFLSDHSKLSGRSGKLARLDEMLEEVLAEGDRALIFTQFAEMGELLRQHLSATCKRDIPFLHGSLSKPQRDRQIAAFQDDEDGPPIFILSLKAGGLGLNLTRANHVFHFDRWWNPAVENQATDRAFRIGQTRAVQVHKFICLGTLEERINQMIEQKVDIATNVVGTGEGWLTELSTEQLRDIFALRPEAVAV